MVDRRKIKAIMDLLAPNNVDEMRSYMGLAGYYRGFIGNLCKTGYHITSLQRKGKNFEWNIECSTSFDELKYFLTNALILKIVDHDKEFVICTNSCNK